MEFYVVRPALTGSTPTQWYPLTSAISQFTTGASKEEAQPHYCRHSNTKFSFRLQWGQARNRTSICPCREHSADYKATSAGLASPKCNAMRDVADSLMCFGRHDYDGVELDTCKGAVPTDANLQCRIQLRSKPPCCQKADLQTWREARRRHRQHSEIDYDEARSHRAVVTS